jgi:ubiquitin carboxyl-terminal hydrolase 34
MYPSHTLSERLFRAHLFPEIAIPTGDAPTTDRVPTLHSQTRQEIYAIILALSNDIIGYQRLLNLVRELLPQGEENSHAWTWGIAQISEDYQLELNWNFSRSKSIRSPVGYPGLRNLSNTCYMNSILTQLFMNVSFRGFILNTNIADGNSSQRLLSETKKLFAFMQESILRSVDTQGIADSVVNYENTLIDVSVQMDVDEFYNLLFDRWESQILSDEGKKRFKRFYGGQIVQQIKSKECPHISERIEPFSAIQCEIQGKANLMESLNAYVGGEVMEGGRYILNNERYYKGTLLTANQR